MFDLLKKLFRLRMWFVLFLPIAVLAALWYTDPDGGVSTKIWMLRFATASVAMGAAHFGRRVLFDYPEADARRLFRTAGQESTGAGLALIALAIVLFGLLMLFGGQVRAQDVHTFIPPQAMQYLPVLAAEQRAHWPSHPAPAALAALVEHESGCFALKRMCWSPTARLKSAREEGAGLSQITRTWRKDGSARFDSLTELRGRHPALSDWSWENVYQRPDLQLRALVLMSRDNFQALARVVRDPMEVLAFADAAYNGGLGGVQSERRACQMSPGCDPQKWWGHVDGHCTKSRAALYGQRSACDINRFHVVDVLQARLPKYRGLV